MSKKDLILKKSGRPIGSTKYNPEMDAKVLALGKLGKSKNSIACHLGIDESTFHTWTNPDSRYYKEDFSLSVLQATAESKDFWETIVETAALEDRKVNATVLALLMRNRFNYDSKQQVEVTGANGAPFVLNINLQ